MNIILAFVAVEYFYRWAVAMQWVQAVFTLALIYAFLRHMLRIPYLLSRLL